MKQMENGLDDMVNQGNEGMDKLLDQIKKLKEKENNQGVKDHLEDLHKQLKEVMY